MTLSRCSPKDPALVCNGRMLARQRGAFWPSPHLRAWLWSGSRDVLTPVVRCPWCQVVLPPAYSPVSTDHGEGWE